MVLPILCMLLLSLRNLVEARGTISGKNIDLRQIIRIIEALSEDKEKALRHRTAPTLIHLTTLNHVAEYDQVSGFALLCTLTLPLRRIRFAHAVCSLLPIASFRLCRCQQRPCDSDCLPPDRGDACFLQQARFAGSAGQTQHRPA